MVIEASDTMKNNIDSYVFGKNPSSWADILGWSLLTKKLFLLQANLTRSSI